MCYNNSIEISLKYYRLELIGKEIEKYRNGRKIHILIKIYT